jgi:DNA gyrase/topoisomerase IV subunit B
MTKSKTVEETYRKLSQREHILERSGMYIGSTKKQLEELWVAEESSETYRMVKKMVEYTPGFIKIFDEILTNATDHTTRDSTVNTIKVDFDKSTGEISIWNNGSGIPIVLHKEHNMYVPELIFGNLLSGSNYDDSIQRTGAGTNGLGSKCIFFETNVPLFNGTIKQAKDVKIGDILIGDDGNPRKVLSKVDGYGEMYKIKQGLGEDYIVNNNHILTVHMPDHKIIFWNENGWSALWWNNNKKCIETKFIKVFDKVIECTECKIILQSRLKRHYQRIHKDKEIPKFTRKPPSYGDLSNPLVREKYDEMKNFLNNIPFENTFDINIQDYLSLNTTTQRRLAGVRGSCVNWEEKHVKLDPYILGLWLGDGMKCGRRYSCDGKKDYQIIDYLTRWGEQNDMKLKYTGHYSYYLSSIKNFGKKNYSPLKNLLKHYNLINNKHIPKDYLINSREVRLKVLAGLIDTDGTVCRNGTRVIITQGYKHKQLAHDILYLARSLGFHCTFTDYISSYTWRGEKLTSKAYKINISGNICEIPTLLPRKVCNNTKSHNTDKTTGYIQIEKIENGKYVGFHLDGNQRFVINDFTVTHNCTNVYSKRFIVETVDSNEKKRFIQEFTDNMSQKTKPKITSNSGKSYTKITFLPDYARFGMRGLEEDAISIITKRVIDCIACTGEGVQIYLNGKKLKGKGLIDYTKYFFEGEKIISDSFVSGKKGEFVWEWAIVPSESFEQISFVNGNSTTNGGKHVDYILGQIINKLKVLLETKKKLKDVKPAIIKERIFLFLRSTIANPSFNSQTKEFLTTPTKDFGCKVEVSDKYVEKIYKSAIIDDIIQTYKLKESLDMAKSTDGKKTNRIFIPKLEDAIWAGSSRSDQCTLILTEGDSAKTFAMWGRSIVGNERFAIYPLKGKVLNIRDATVSQLMNNEEINNLKQIIGLKQGKEYKSVSELRYGKVMILTDADVDGLHISSLIVNFIHSFWPSLLKLDFLQTLRTPIVKVTRSGKTLEFFTEGDYNNWKNSVGENSLRGYTIKYFKGLGTSKKEDAQAIFKRFNELKADFYYKDEKCDEAILLAFDKDKTKNGTGIVSCADRRKKWLSNYDREDFLDIKQSKISFSELIHKGLIHFSIYDNVRSIPHLIDGLKPSQRKILWYMLDKKITRDIKVAQLSGYVSAETSYHHGEASLQGAIVGMAQDFVGSNNLPLLVPEGNFGSRFGAKDAASPRYIFTRLQPWTTHIFDERDAPLLNYLNDDGQSIEPDYFVPIIPMVLVNGCEGIGTGFSTYIPPHNPKDVISNLIRVLDGKEPLPMKPYFRNFRGYIEEGDSETSWTTKGKWKKLSGTKIEITELPIGVWITPYKEFLESMIETGGRKKDKEETKAKRFVLRDVQNNTKDENDGIQFMVEFKSESDLEKLISTGTLEKELRLTKSFTTSNMYLFDESLIPTKYLNTTDILLDFYDIRLEMYGKRREYLIDKLKKELVVLEAKVQFISEYINGKLDINRKTKDVIFKLLKDRNYPVHTEENTYDYLIRMQISSLTSEKIEELEKMTSSKRKDLLTIQSKTDSDLWREDLESLRSNLD